MALRISFICFVSLLESQPFAHCYVFPPDETVSCNRELGVSMCCHRAVSCDCLNNGESLEAR